MKEKSDHKEIEGPRIVEITLSIQWDGEGEHPSRWNWEARSDGLAKIKKWRDIKIPKNKNESR